MKIKVIDVYELEKRHACWGYSTLPINTYEVLAIKQAHRKIQYLVEDDMRLTWWDADLFNIVEETIPKEWVKIKYKCFHSLQNKKYNFKIVMNCFWGPNTFLENEDFLFDIFENPHTAYVFYKKYQSGDGSVCSDEK